METGKFLECALLAGACALPLLAVGAVVTRDDEDAWIPSRCDGCGEIFRSSELTAGDVNTRWCAVCIADTAPPAPAFDCVVEDDGEP